MSRQYTREEIFNQISKDYPHLLNGDYNPDDVIDFFIENMEINQKKTKHIEIDIWTDKIERFRNEFASMNDVKFDNSEVVATQGVDKRYSLSYRNFGGELKFPEQGYYQLNNVWEEDF